MILIYRREKSNPSPIIFKGTKELGTFRSRLGTFRLMYHAYHGTFLLEVVSFDQMYHAEVVSFAL